MIKTLVTSGYHYSEREWGNAVIDFYKNSSMQGKRNISFYEIKTSDVFTGDNNSFSSNIEVSKIIKKRGINFWIDIHCAIHRNTQSQKNIEQKTYDILPHRNILFLAFYGSDDNLVEKLKKNIPHGIDVYDPTDLHTLSKKRYNIPSRVVIDPSFIEEQVTPENPLYHKHLRNSAELINQIYDLAANSNIDTFFKKPIEKKLFQYLQRFKK